MENGKLRYFSLLLLLFFVTARSSSVHVANGNFEKVLLDLQKVPWKEEQKGNFVFQQPKVEKGAATLQMHQTDYCSNEVTDWDQNLQTRLILDVLHVKSLQARFKSPTFSSDQLLNPLSGSDSRIPVTSGVHLQTLNFIVTVALGGRNLTLAMDTGSDLTWIQCRPCQVCYAQQDPLFDPASSPSYLPLPCNSTACSDLQPAIGNTGTCERANANANATSCAYSISYGDGSYTRGELGFERLSFGAAVIDKFIFGCGRNNKGLYGGTAGLIGLSNSDLSIVSQASSVFGRIFSYCLPSAAAAAGSLTMGAGDFANFRNVSPISYTRMVLLPDFPGFYFLNVTGISVGSVKLDVPRFGAKRDMNIIDSGTVITRLSPMIYRALKAEFERQFLGFPAAPGYSILNTCYNLKGINGKMQVPSIKFHFEGNVEMVVDPEGVFYAVKSDSSLVCLAFTSLTDEDEIGIIGNYQQKNQRVVYDLKESRVGFAAEPCTF